MTYVPLFCSYHILTSPVMKTHDKMEQTIKLCFMNINTRYEIGTWLSFDNGLAGEANIISLQYMLPGFLSNSTKC